MLPESVSAVTRKPLKRPVSVLVVLHDGAGNILLLQRADRPDYWQSVTGSVEEGETPFAAALREVAEETGMVLHAEQLTDHRRSVEYEIFPHWRHRYPEGVTRNVEHQFSAIIGRGAEITLAPAEHLSYRWLAAADAAAQVFSPSNAELIARVARD